MKKISEFQIVEKKCKAGRKIHGSIFEYISSIDFLSYTGHINFIDTGTFQYKKREKIC